MQVYKRLNNTKIFTTATSLKVKPRKNNSSLQYMNAHSPITNHTVYQCRKVAYCDAGATYGSTDTPDLVSDLNNKIYDSIYTVPVDDLQLPIKSYPLELKPLTFAFSFKHLSLTTVRAFLLYYLPLLEPRPPSDDDDDDDLLEDDSERPPVDLVTPFHKSLQQIAREVTYLLSDTLIKQRYLF
jgi:hypothetical protein